MSKSIFFLFVVLLCLRNQDFVRDVWNLCFFCPRVLCPDSTVPCKKFNQEFMGSVMEWTCLVHPDFLLAVFLFIHFYSISQISRSTLILWYLMVMLEHNVVLVVISKTNKYWLFGTSPCHGGTVKNSSQSKSHHFGCFCANFGTGFWSLDLGFGVEKRDVSFCQDVGHPGYNNNFLINLRHEYAVTFGDLDVLEIGKQTNAWKVLRMTPKHPKHACTVSCVFWFVLKGVWFIPQGCQEHV